MAVEPKLSDSEAMERADVAMAVSVLVLAFGPSAGPLPSRPAVQRLAAQCRKPLRPLGGPARLAAFSRRDWTRG